jgi:hypothetical protein
MRKVEVLVYRQEEPLTITFRSLRAGYEYAESCIDKEHPYLCLSRVQVNKELKETWTLFAVSYKQTIVDNELKTEPKIFLIRFKPH